MLPTKPKARMPRSPTEGSPAVRAVAVVPHIRSRDLFGAAQEVVIEHNERTYRLRVTAQGKLLLTA
jgi:hemin uptake protein HemP